MVHGCGTRTFHGCDLVTSPRILRLAARLDGEHWPGDASTHRLSVMLLNLIAMHPGNAAKERGGDLVTRAKAGAARRPPGQPRGPLEGPRAAGTGDEGWGARL